MTRHTAAGIDIGTNTTRLLIIDPEGRELERHMSFTRLGEGVDKNGYLLPEAIERTLDTLKDYANLLDQHGVRRLRMTATSASRDASNRDEFFLPATRIISCSPELLPGNEEATLSFLGAVADLSIEASETVVFDIGGGSTEFAAGQISPTRVCSRNIGSVRLTERFFTSLPPTEAELNALNALLDEEFKAAAELIQPVSDATWVGVAGTTTSLAAMTLGLRQYTPESTHGYILSRQAVEDSVTQLSQADLQKTKELILETKRAPVILAGALILRGIMRHFALQEIIVSEHDILDGLAESAAHLAKQNR